MLTGLFGEGLIDYIFENRDSAVENACRLGYSPHEILVVTNELA